VQGSEEPTDEPVLVLPEGWHKKFARKLKIFDILSKINWNYL
jgi:hypothetical protein